MKKGFLLFLCSFLSIPVTFAAFTDIPDGSRYKAPVDYLQSKNIIHGYKDNTFRPDQTIQRDEALKIILSAEKAVNPAQTQNYSQTVLKFPDIKTTDWFYPFVQEAFSRKIVEGYKDGTFKPQNKISAVEGLKILTLTFGFQPESTFSQENLFPDIKTTDWFAPFIALSKTKQWIEPSGDGKSYPNHSLTRGEFAEIVYRLLYTQENKLEKFPLSADWKSYTDSKGNFTIKYPFDWQKIEAGNQVIFWKKDEANQQVSFSRIYPNSAVVIMAVDSNPGQLTLVQYLEELTYEKTVQKEILTLNGLPFGMMVLAEQGLQDHYFEMPNKAIVVAYSQVGDGALQSHLKEQIRYMIGSLRYADGKPSEVTPEQPPDEKELLLSELREKILVKGVGKEVIEALKDAIIFETDAIGIGTGPIDYYYSATYDVSVKYERNSNTVLGIKTGKSTSF